jgi:hypothetical protein
VFEPVFASGAETNFAANDSLLGGMLQRQTAIGISDVFMRNISGWGGSIALGCGMTPPLTRFFGLRSTCDT